MNSSNRSNDSPIIAEDGAAYTTQLSRDPFEALDDLMTVVESLTPTWPTREITKEGPYWLL